MSGYYARGLGGERLRRCYELAPDRVRRYLEAEIQFVLSRLRPTDVVLELGCGYGRVALRLAERAARVVGIDTSRESLDLALTLAGPGSACEFLEMDAAALTFADGVFDAVVCVQNGVCAFAVDPERLFAEALRVTRPSGRVLVSTYAPAFWPQRLAWFEAQAAAGLVGAIDYDRTVPGAVVCRDGFRSGTFAAEDFREVCRRLGVVPALTTVDQSSVFCELEAPPAAPAVEGAGAASLEPFDGV
jgi:SAM-dependent methyltransferase